MTTIGESISRVRGIMKGVREDAFLTDRFVYSIISKYAKVLLRRQQNEKKLMGHDDLFEMLSFIELIDVDKIEAECAPIKTNCVIKRTKDKLPNLFNGQLGPLIRKVYSIDGSFDFNKISPASYISINSKSCTKYDNAKYYWFRNGHLYLPDTNIEAIMIEGLWEDLLDGFCTLDKNDCTPMQDRKLPLPEYLFAEVEQMVEQEFGMTVRLPGDGADDGQNVLR
tara:strand:- start:14023 stop:14694 length:672 start_codon:yes stop_codon:yes gene_type:complete